MRSRNGLEMILRSAAQHMRQMRTAINLLQSCQVGIYDQLEEPRIAARYLSQSPLRRGVRSEPGVALDELCKRGSLKGSQPHASGAPEQFVRQHLTRAKC